MQSTERSRTLYMSHTSGELDYRYTSGSLLGTPVGSMRGSYAFRSRGGEEFKAPIPVFTLSVPGALN